MKSTVKTALLILIVVAVIASLTVYTHFSHSKPTPSVTTPTPTTTPQQVATQIQTTATQTPEEPYVQIIDVLNRTVRIPRNLSRIVAIGPGALRLVTYINATHLLVGVEQLELKSCVGRDYAMAFCELFSKLPVIGPGGPRSLPNPEMIMQVKPQLIVMYRGYASQYPPERLEAEVGVPVLVIDYGAPGYLQIDFLNKALALLGKALGKEERARQLIEYINSIEQDLQNRVKNIQNKPLIYIGAISYAGAQPFTASQARFAPLVLLNTSSIVDSLKPEGGYIQVDFEYLLEKQPDYIFIDENNLRVVLDDFSKNREQYCSLKAFREGRVYGVLPFNWYHTNIATALANAYFMGKVLYPEAFADVDPVQKANEIFEVFVGKPLYQEFVNGGYQGFANLSDVFKCG
uniref:Iron ABC transporter substrate-binding protein n=1 Tax=Ignisphaera aggregans TaxID=334771 RepID=A0A7C4BCX3_9CREN